MGNVLRSLRLITDPTRLRIMRLLASEELSVAEMQGILGMGQSRISASLGLLRREGMVSDRRVGKNSFYTARTQIDQAIRQLLDKAIAELPEAENDEAALKLTLAQRRDKAAAYFERLAGKFGRTYIPGRSWQALAHGLLSLQPAEVIADLGAGEGTLSQLLARNATKVIAVDNAPAMVEFGSKMAKTNGFHNLEYRLGDIEDPPIEDRSVDLTLFSQALHHAASPPRAIQAAARILKPGGRVLILDLASHSYEQAKELYAHVWLGFSEVELVRMLEGAGFEGVRTSIVARERRAPNFQTILATGQKPGHS